MLVHHCMKIVSMDIISLPLFIRCVCNDTEALKGDYPKVTEELLLIRLHLNGVRDR
jgi:hypothetical protein